MMKKQGQIGVLKGVRGDRYRSCRRLKMEKGKVVVLSLESFEVGN